MNNFFAYSKTNSSKVVCFTAFLLFFSLNVFYRWENSYLTILAYSYDFIFLFYFLNKKIVEDKNSVFFAISFSLLFLWQQITSNANITSIILNTLFPFLLFIPIKIRYKSLDFFITIIFPVLLTISYVSYILWAFDIINLPSFAISSRGNKEYNFISHIFFIVPDIITELERFHAFFDEPGVIGTLSAVILFFYRDRLNKFAMISYSLSGMLSFSLFFYIMVVILLVSRFNKITDALVTIILFFLLGFLIYWLYDIDYLESRIFNRLLIENGSLSGNNRNTIYFLNYFYNTFVYSQDILFGSSDAFTSSDKASGNWSVQVFIYRYGALYVIYSIVLYSLYFWKYKTSCRNFFISILVWGLMTYQRPSFTDLFYFILFTTCFQSNYLKLHNNRGRCKVYPRGDN